MKRAGKDSKGNPTYKYYDTKQKEYIKNMLKFPGSLVVRTWHFHCQGLGFIPGQGTKMP